MTIMTILVSPWGTSAGYFSASLFPRWNLSLTMMASTNYIAYAFETRFARPPRSRRTGKRVQIPRCRATVSEDIAPGHWS